MKKIIFGILFLIIIVFITSYIYLNSRNPIVNILITGLTRGNFINKKISTGAKEIDGKIGGGYTYYYSAICGELQKNKYRYESSIIVDLGDNLFGTPLVYYNYGKLYSSLVNLLPQKGIVLGGNLDTLYGLSVFKKRIQESGWKLVLSNVTIYGSRKCIENSSPYYNERKDGINFGFIGFAPENLDNSLMLSMSKELSVSTEFESLVPSIKNSRMDGADVIIVLSQYDIWRYPERMIKLKEFVNKYDIDIFIGLNFKKFNKKIVNSNGHFIVSFFGLNECTQLKNIKLTFDREVKKIIKCEQSVKFVSKNTSFPSKNVTELINSEVDKIEDIVGQNIAYNQVTLFKKFDKSSTLGNFICDIVKDKYNSDIVLLNSGSIREDLKKGYVNLGDLYNIIPFDNLAVKLSMTGRKIIQFIKDAFDNNRPFQVSGIKFELFKKIKDNKNDFELKNVKVNGEKIKLNKKYSLVINSFTAFIFKDFLNKNIIGEIQYFDNIRKIVEQYLKRKKFIKEIEYKNRYIIKEVD